MCARPRVAAGTLATTEVHKGVGDVSDRPSGVQVPNLAAPMLVERAPSVTRRMAASLPRVRAQAQARGLRVHHLGAGYPHPEVTDPRAYVEQTERFFAARSRAQDNVTQGVPEIVREAFNYTDTMGPRSVREAFGTVYGRDWGVAIDADRLVPTVGATGGINLVCSLFERPGQPLAWITDAPTYAGFLARATLNRLATVYSVDMDAEGPRPDMFRAQILAARASGAFVPCYYTVPDGHNPAGFSFSDRRRLAILEIAREEGVLILEDAPYVYISFAAAAARPRPFIALDPRQTIHLFTGSKIGLPGPRVGFVYTEAEMAIADGKRARLGDLLQVEAAGDMLFHNPQALYGFEALLHDEQMVLRQSLWPVAERKLAVYRENRQIVLDGLERQLGAYRDRFVWTQPEAGFFSVFTFRNPRVTTDEAFTERLVAEYGVVAIPMYEFFPADARARNPRAGLDSLRLSFCFSESTGAERLRDMREATTAFCAAALAEG